MLDQLDDKDLEAVAAGNLNAVSDRGLELLSSMKDAPADQPRTAADAGQSLAPSQATSPNFEIPGMSQTARGGSAQYAPPIIQPGEQFNPARALLTNEPVETLPNKLVRGIPSAAGAMAGMALGPAGVFSGAAGGEGIRQGAAGLYSMARGSDAPQPGEVVGNMAKEGALNLAGYAGGKAIAAVPAAVGRAYEWGAKNLGGMSEQTIQAMKQNASGVADRLGVDREALGALGEKARGAISGAIQKGEDFYRNVAERITRSGGPESDVRINVADSLGRTLNGIKEQFGYSAPIAGTADTQVSTGILDRFGSPLAKTIPGKAPVPGVNRVVSPDEAREFSKFDGLIRGMKDATPEQVYYLQRDLNAAISRFKGSPLGAALRELRNGVHDVIEQNGEALPDLLQANRTYRAVRELEDEAGKFTNADDAVRYIKNVFSPNKYESQSRAALENVARQVPEVGAAIQEVLLGSAAQEASPLLRSLPQTGFGSAMVAGGGAAAYANPAALLAAPAFSPRAYLAGYQVAQSGAGQAVQNGLAAAYNALPKSAIPLAATAGARYIVK